MNFVTYNNSIYSVTHTTVGCQGSNWLRLDKCWGRRGTVMRIISVFWGRLGRTTCPSNSWGKNTNFNCKGNTQSINVVKHSCNAKRICDIMPDPTKMGDPCPGTPKYLKVVYECIAAPPPTADKIGTMGSSVIMNIFKRTLFGRPLHLSVLSKCPLIFKDILGTVDHCLTQFLSPEVP
jgi:hypothetical protein